MKERAHKFIAQSGMMSRRKAEAAIAEGRVALNGVVFTQMGQLVDTETDVLTVDGEVVKAPAEKKTFLFYKPRGVVTTKSDEKGRPTVMDFFADEPTLNPVGRLDYDSEGLLLMTQDGELLLRLTHPRYGVKKVYEVTVEGECLELEMNRLLGGIALEDGMGKFDEITPVVTGRTFNVVVSEGRNRFIRRMFTAVGCEVIRLKRLEMGQFRLDDLQPGDRVEIEIFAEASSELTGVTETAVQEIRDENSTE